MKKTSYVFRDPVVERVVDKFVSRSDVGYEKYGTTLHEERTTKLKGLFKYINDIQEKLMDAILYIQAAKEEIQDLSEEALIKKYEYINNIEVDEERMDIIGKNGNDGLNYEEETI